MWRSSSASLTSDHAAASGDERACLDFWVLGGQASASQLAFLGPCRREDAESCMCYSPFVFVLVWDTVELDLTDFLFLFSFTMNFTERTILVDPS